jgi:hypothetical protein
VWQQLENGRVVHRYEWIVLAATLAVIPVLVIEIDVKSAGWQTFAYTATGKAAPYRPEPTRAARK